VLHPWALLQGPEEGETSPVPQSSGSSDGDRFGNPDHAVEHRDGNAALPC
jgi:hypothetical protein